MVTVSPPPLYTFTGFVLNIKDLENMKALIEKRYKIALTFMEVDDMITLVKELAGA